MSFPIHPDDEPSFRFGGWADDFNTYTEACEYYGCDTPAQLAAEAAYDLARDRIAAQDEMEARGGPVFRRSPYPLPYDDDLPF
jgi:hypothetical protein